VGKFAAGLTILACVFGSVLIGMFSQRRLPEHHTSKESQEVIRLAIGTIATLSALVVGLLIATAKTSYELKDFELKQFAANLILLDRQLAHIEPDTKEIRELLRRYTVYKIDSLWRTEDRLSATEPNGWRLLEDVQDRIRALKPADEAQRWLQSHALLLSSNLALSRWLLLEQGGSSMPMPFLIVLVFWLCIIFGSFGLFAPINMTVVAALFVCSLSLAGALSLILDMDHPFDGLMRISSAPMRDALAHLEQ
jgi:hypothetical protein